MGLASEVIIGRALNPGAALTALTPGTGDTFAVRSFPSESRAYIEGIWAQGATAGVVRVRSPRLHDNVQGIRFRTVAAVTRDFFGDQDAQPLYPQDVLIFEGSGGGAETDCFALWMYYNDLPGTDARLAQWAAIQPRIRNILTQEIAVAGPVTAGDWSAGNALNATFDLLKANVDYAVLGYQTDTACLAVGFRGPDTGNLRIGGPGTTESIETRDWFVSGSREGGLAYIPVINAANKGATLVSVANSTAAGTFNVDLILAELAPQ
jgi:hypothetical protein